MNRPAPKPTPQADAEEWLSAAECATRTGLTVRALRVYERQGLIKPARSPNGWRRYGPAELERLNSIVILKGLGLTLSQIRTVLAENPPSLLRILQIHAQSWRAKRAMADRALGLVHAALERLRAQQAPSVAELCELLKRLESNRNVDMTSAVSLTRQLINENTTAEEERAWHTWCAEHPDEVAEMQAFAKDQEGLSAEVKQLIEYAVDPSSEAMQDLLRRHNVLLAQYGVRERNRRLRAWNSNAIAKWWTIGVKARRLADPGQGARLQEYWGEAVRQSAWYKAFREVMRDVREIMSTQSDPASSELDTPVERVREICAQYALGDALTFTEWTRFSIVVWGPYAPSPYDLFDPEWEFILHALEAREGRS
jgi:DNA-binding transcriptional MerR regulator